MRIVSKKWTFDNLNSSSNVNTTVSDTVKNIIKHTSLGLKIFGTMEILLKELIRMDL